MREIDLGQANLQAANLSQADLTGTDLIGANLSEANLEDAILFGAEFDSTTKWRTGFDAEAAEPTRIG